FALNSSTIPFSERGKLAKIAEYLKTNPDSKVLLVGFADKKTGNATINLRLSHSRAEVVATELRHQGIAPGRVIVEWKGDKEQPFNQNDWNRVVVIFEK
ncbi:MAG: OmpA family protein, partial [Candidatus Symbiothrix sp.]|nr:OmpA family protein [Candidatus Symbiothrix sp.]